MKQEVFVVELKAEKPGGKAVITKVVFRDEKNAIAFAMTMKTTFEIDDLNITMEIGQTVLLEDTNDILEYFSDSLKTAVDTISKNTISDKLNVPVPSNN